MIALHRTEQPQPATRTLREVVTEFLRFHDEPQVGMSYETRMELKRRHFADLREAVGISPQTRAGSTLTEVLMAILIMSIGIVSIASMFPLAVVRAAKATQLTQGTDLRFNAEAMIDINPRMVLDPGLDGTLDLAGTNFVVDPIGWVLADQVAFGARDEYGNRGGVTIPVTRFPFGCNLAIPRMRLSAAEDLACLPDSWETTYEGNITLDPTGLGGLMAGASAGGVPTYPVVPSAPPETPRPRYRITIIAPDGVTKQQRMLTQFVFGADTLLWSEDFNGDSIINGAEIDVNSNGAADGYPLPNSFRLLPGQFTARIEARDRRYTWLLTVRKGGTNGGEVDCVVFFKRPFDNLRVEEYAYEANFTKGSGQAVVRYRPATEEKPWLKKGGFIFDATNARWCRIAGVVSEIAGPAAGQVTYTIQLETPAIQSSPPTGGLAVLPKGVVDVFPLGTKSYTLP